MSGKKHKAQRAAARARAKAASVMMTDLPMQQLAEIVERTRTESLNPEDHAILKVAMDSFAFVTEELKNRNTSFQRLRQMLFGSPTEKTAAVLGEKTGFEAPSGSAAQGSDQRPSDRTERPEKRKGHGRYAAAALTGAEKVKVPHRELAAGEACLDPHCRGKVYPLAEPKKLVRITGVAPLSATVYECDRLRCNDCGAVFSTAAPEGVGDEKYDEAATAMVGMLRFGVGLPHNRIEKLQAGMGIPLPTSTQWDLVAEGADEVEPAFEELIRQGAQAPFSQACEKPPNRERAVMRRSAGIAGKNKRFCGKTLSIIWGMLSRVFLGGAYAPAIVRKRSSNPTIQSPPWGRRVLSMDAAGLSARGTTFSRVSGKNISGHRSRSGIRRRGISAIGGAQVPSPIRTNSA